MSKGRGFNGSSFIPGAGNKQGGANKNVGGNNGSNLQNQSVHNQTSRSMHTNPSHIGGRGGK